jgi:L-threonylcarbamoyladenylate synthase
LRIFLFQTAIGKKHDFMGTVIVTIDPAHPEPAFARCREVIGSGGVIAYPTDTFYGLGADPRNPHAVKRLFEIKGRPIGQPILLLLHDRSRVREWAQGVTAEAEALMDAFWPGPLTLVFTALPSVLPELTGGMGRIGLRVPGNEVTRRLLDALGTALTGTSANRSGDPDLQTAQDVAGVLGERVDLILDAGRTLGGKASTVVDVSAAGLTMVREGAVSEQELRDTWHKFKKKV